MQSSWELVGGGMPDIVEIARKTAGLDKTVWDEFK